MGKHEQLKGILYEILDDNKGWLSFNCLESKMVNGSDTLALAKASTEGLSANFTELFIKNDIYFSF